MHADFPPQTLLIVRRRFPGTWRFPSQGSCTSIEGLHTSALGALLTFSQRPWYGPYEATAPLWGLTALEDQQLGGLIMWVPGGTVFLVAALASCAAWLRTTPRALPGMRAGP